MYEFELKRSNRKTLAIQITKDCRIIVRAPEKLSEKIIRKFVESKTDWIKHNLEKQHQIMKNTHEFSDDEVKFLKLKAKEYIIPKVAQYAEIMGLDYGKIKITSAKTRYGSCNTKTHNLCFSYILMTKPQAAIDYVIVHELAHIVHPNHSKNFYCYISKFLPDYKQREKMLKSSSQENL